MPTPGQTTPASAELVVVCGPAGVGKTTIAETIATQLDGQVLRTDVVRKELFPTPEYTAEESNAVYTELFNRAQNTLTQGQSVVLDATFREEERREQAAALTSEQDAPFRIVKVECDKSVVKERLAQRESDASDADFDIHVQQRESFDALERDHITIDNSANRAETLQKVTHYFSTAATTH